MLIPVGNKWQQICFGGIRSDSGYEIIVDILLIILHINVQKAKCLMKSVSFTEFRRHASGLFTQVQEGETLLILRHGHPIAEIIPAAETEAKAPSWKRPGLRLSAKGARLSTAILEGRKHEGLL